jgi:MscS family membrane protein
MIPANLKTTTLLIFILAFSPTSFAQDKASTETSATPPVVVDTGPEDALNRGTPRGSIIGFLEASSVFDFEKAAQFLDLRNLPEEAEELGGRELARQLNHVLSRAVWLDDYTVSDKPGGVKGDNLPDYRDQLVVIKTKQGDVPMWMQHVPRGDGEEIWKVSNRSVALVPELYDEFSYPAYIERIRNWFPEDAAFLGVEAFKWLIFIFFALLSWPVFRLIGLLLIRVFSSPGSPTYPLWRKIMTGPMVAVGIILVGEAVIARLGVGAIAQEIMQRFRFCSSSHTPVTSRIW